MNESIRITSDKMFNGYFVAPRDCEAMLSRLQWNHLYIEDVPRKVTAPSYWVSGYVNGVYTRIELHNYNDAKKLFLAMCKA